ncbi:MAG: hypothetical protein ACR2O6_04700 [Ilumatobacteraceae bacterium]
MRQLFSLRLVAAVLALAGLAFLVRVAVAEDTELAAIVEPDIPDRRVDLISPIFASTASEDFRIRFDGTTVGYLDLILPEERAMRIAPGTTGEISCDQLDEINRCAVFADLLGDAVVWFAVLPQAPRSTVELPPIVDLEDGYAIFENGWQIRYPPVIERDCGSEDIPTFSDFLRRFGPDSVSIVDLEVQEVTTVRCGDEVVAPTTIPPSTVVQLEVLNLDSPLQAPTSLP